MTGDRDQRVAVVTGGGTGLGRGITEVLSGAGIRCAIVGRRRAPLEETERCLADFFDRAAEHAHLLADQLAHQELSVERFLELSGE